MKQHLIDTEGRRGVAMDTEDKAHLLAGARAVLYDLATDPHTQPSEHVQLKLEVAVRLLDDVLRDVEFRHLDGTLGDYNAW